MAQAYGHHTALQALTSRVQVPLWVDALAEKWAVGMHGLTFLCGFVVTTFGAALSAGLTPKWSAAALLTTGGSVMLSCSMAIYAVFRKRPDLLTASLYGLLGVLAWVIVVATVLVILLAQVDSPVSKYVICNWDAEKAELPDGLCTQAQVLAAPVLVDCTDPNVDLGTIDKTECQQRWVDDVHSALAAVNSMAGWTLSILAVCLIVIKKVRTHFSNTGDEMDAFTKLVAVFLLLAAAAVTMSLIVVSLVWWEYTYTSVIFVVVGMLSVLSTIFSLYVVVKGRVELFSIIIAQTTATIVCLFITYLFGGFFTGNLQTVSEFYHSNYDEVRDAFVKFLPNVCTPGMTDGECKKQMKLITLDKLDDALLFLLSVALFVAIMCGGTYRVVVSMIETVNGLHGLSQFELSTLEKVLWMSREEIVHATDLYWALLHHPHRPCNEVLMSSKGSVTEDMESSLRNAERKRLKSRSPKMLAEECMKAGLDPIGPPNNLRERLLRAYSADRMQKRSPSDNAAADDAKTHFFVLGEAELRMIPALAWCPFVDRLIRVFSTANDGYLHFEEFLNMYSIMSPTCPTESKIKYAWCIFDLQGTGDITLEEVRTIVMHIMGLSEQDLDDETEENQDAELADANGKAPATEQSAAIKELNVEMGGTDDLDGIGDLDQLDDAMGGLSDTGDQPLRLSVRVQGGDQQQSSIELLKECWSDLDLDDSGLLDEMELMLVLQQIAPDMTGEEVTSLIEALDKDEDGGVSYEEFEKYWLTLDADAQATIASAAGVAPPVNGTTADVTAALSPQPEATLDADAQATIASGTPAPATEAAPLANGTVTGAEAAAAAAALSPQPEVEASISIRAGKRSKKENIELLKSIWNEFDLDGSGMLEEMELVLVLEQICPDMSSDEAAGMMAKLDKDQDGSVSLAEFQKYWLGLATGAQAAVATHAGITLVPEAEKQKKRSRRQNTALLKSIWSSMDLDGSGLLDETELRLVLQQVQPDMDEAEMTELISSIDKDSDGSVSQEEFLKYWLKLDASDQVAIAGADAVSEVAAVDSSTSVVVQKGLGAISSSLQTSEEALEAQRKRRAKMREDKLSEVEQQQRQERKRNLEDLEALVSMIMNEVDEDGDKKMNFTEFRKSLKRSEQFVENFCLPYPNADEILAYPQAELTSGDELGEVLTEAEKKQLLEFSIGHRRRKKSLEAEEAEDIASNLLSYSQGKLAPPAPPKPASPRAKVVNPMHNLESVDSIDDQVSLEEGAHVVTTDEIEDNTRGPLPANPIKRRQSKKLQEKLESDRAARRMFQKFEIEQKEQAKRIAKSKESLGEGRDVTSLRSIYSQLVMARLNEIDEELVNREKSKKKKLLLEEKLHKQRLNNDSNYSLTGVFSIDMDTMTASDIKKSLAVKAFEGAWTSSKAIAISILEAFDKVQKEDNIPFWKDSVMKIEGDFGGGIASVFTLRRWLFCINLISAISWLNFVIVPFWVLQLSAEVAPTSIFEVLVNTATDSSGSTSTDAVQNASSIFSDIGVQDFRWIYYSSYEPIMGTYRMDFWYLAVVVVLFVSNLFSILRNIAHAIAVKFQNDMADEKRSYACSSLLFGAYCYSSEMRKIVEVNQKTIRNSLKTVLMTTRAAANSKQLGIKAEAKRALGILTSIFLAWFMGFLIRRILQNVAALNEAGVSPNLLITLIKIMIPNLIPPIVAFEGRDNVAEVMRHIILRIFLVQMVSLYFMFEELLQLQNATSDSGQCFEDVAGTIYMKSVLTDFFATMVGYAWQAASKAVVYWKLINGGLRGLKEGVPHAVARALTKQKLPKYESADAANDVISLLYGQCVIWVGSTVCPAMALCGMATNGIMFFASKWALLNCYQPPEKPWGGDEAKALNSKLVFTTLVFSSGPLLAWVARAPHCGPHAGRVVLATYADYMQTETSPFVRDTVGQFTTYLFDGTSMFFGLLVCVISLYFSNAKNASLKAAVLDLKDDFAREHNERVAVVQVASQLDGFKFTPQFHDDDGADGTQPAFVSLASPRDVDRRVLDLAVSDPNGITWDEVNTLAKGTQLNIPSPTTARPDDATSPGRQVAPARPGIVFNPMNAPPQQAPPPVNRPAPVRTSSSPPAVPQDDAAPDVEENMI